MRINLWRYVRTENVSGTDAYLYGWSTGSFQVSLRVSSGFFISLASPCQIAIGFSTASHFPSRKMIYEQEMLESQCCWWSNSIIDTIIWLGTIFISKYVLLKFLLKFLYTRFNRIRKGGNDSCNHVMRASYD